MTDLSPCSYEPKLRTYVKFEKGDYRYYVGDTPNIVKELRYEQDHHRLMQLSDVVVNTRTNKIIKMRYDLETFLDAALTGGITL